MNLTYWDETPEMLEFNLDYLRRTLIDLQSKFRKSTERDYRGRIFREFNFLSRRISPETLKDWLK